MSITYSKYASHIPIGFVAPAFQTVITAQKRRRYHYYTRATSQKGFNFRP
ncbi:hypothetical protein ACEZ65_004516 [Salmonella enterica]|nr:hypothetical protein [Salmonella enterica]EGW8215710.1 hypothetical protein [Salmonella enterica subsp. diarizonae serovar 61:k:1,5,(7)]EID4347856.1 hypothetical protein [Salmonella enterica subsp. diarizonae]EGB2463650.1 hypothetical protein [Salmonella enterica]EGN4152295.1 hypothetical protein [Salmonella enterica]